MPFTRRGRPGLLGTVARTAVITGTASATASAVNRRAYERAMNHRDAAGYRGGRTAQPVAAAREPDLVARLAELVRLREAGVLTNTEFNAAKAKLLAE